MKRLILCSVIITCILSGLAKCQVPSKEVPGVLKKLYGRLLNDLNDDDRLRINDSVKLIIERYAESDTVFNHRFSDLRYLGQITSSDSLIKIITWNLVLNNAPGRYFLYLIRKNLQGKRNSVYRLSGIYNSDPVRTDTIYHQSDWYGALYYDIKPIIAENKQCWVLLGINYSNPLITRKIIEVLSFSRVDSIIFGRKWFDSGKQVKYREVFEYASNGIMSLRFRVDNSIVFDHLVPVITSQGGDALYYGADSSYDAYNFQDGFWKMKINIDARNTR